MKIGINPTLRDSLYAQLCDRRQSEPAATGQRQPIPPAARGELYAMLVHSH